MRRLSSFLFAAAAPLFIAASLWAGEVKIIANPSVSATSVSAEDLKHVFLLERNSLADGTHVEPVVAKGGPTHDAFLHDYLSKTDSALQTYYRSLVFTGKASLPRTLASEAEVVTYVAKTKGAIGYVSSGTSISGVKVLEVK
jgi:hypothetical protein